MVMLSVATRGDPERGFSLIELVSVLGLVAVLLGISLSIFHQNLYDLDAARARLVADLRLARGHAIEQDVHYRFTITSVSTYEVDKLRQVVGVWVPDSSYTQTNDLPSTAQLENLPGTVIEFDSRGMVTQARGAILLTLRDLRSNAARLVSVWPSGQVLGM